MLKSRTALILIHSKRKVCFSLSQHENKKVVLALFSGRCYYVFVLISFILFGSYFFCFFFLLFWLFAFEYSMELFTSRIRNSRIHMLVMVATRTTKGKVKWGECKNGNIFFLLYAQHLLAWWRIDENDNVRIYYFGNGAPVFVLFLFFFFFCSILLSK